jgi:exosortase/archaeosortase family protein
MSQPRNPRRTSPRELARVASAWLHTPIGYLTLTASLMIAFYSVLYRAYDPAEWPGTWLLAYLEFTAQSSATVLQALGESVTVSGTQVLGGFPYVVVIDCAALDAQALFAAAVLAFPVSIWKRITGLAVGVALIGLINTARLVILYFAGMRSMELFHLLHEEVFVFSVVGLVCAIFVLWVLWARDDGKTRTAGSAYGS